MTEDRSGTSGPNSLFPWGCAEFILITPFSVSHPDNLLHVGSQLCFYIMCYNFCVHRERDPVD